jgi:hypothetical protein
MTDHASKYYVYVYIDPRNFEEFYYGKGTGSRKFAHLYDDSDTEKAKRIKAIKKEGLEPIIKVIAKELTEKEAFLVEKTLIWKLGRNLTNKSSGHFAEKSGSRANLEPCASINIQRRLIVLFSKTHPNTKPLTASHNCCTCTTLAYRWYARPSGRKY